MASTTVVETNALSIDTPNTRYPSTAEAMFEIAVFRAQYLYNWARDILGEAAIATVTFGCSDAWNPCTQPPHDTAERYRRTTEAVRSLESLLADWPGDIGADFAKLTEDKCWKEWLRAFTQYTDAIRSYRRSADEPLDVAALSE
jgi:hypothetical protein